MNTSWDRLGRKALFAAAQVRRDAGVGGWDPVCPFDVAAAAGVSVQLTPMKAEGLYSPDPERPLAMVNSDRPGGRMRFTCAHELGHHAFGHGWKLDEVAVGRGPGRDPDEVLADLFAGHLLMPKTGVLLAIRDHGADPSDPNPFSVYAAACEFGVGYGTLLTHLTFAMRVLPRDRARILGKLTPKMLRREWTGGHRGPELTVIGPAGQKGAYDVIQGGLVLALGEAAAGAGLRVEGAVERGTIVRATECGTWPLILDGRETTVRVTPRAFSGRAIYRHLECDEIISATNDP
jgi:hypothetical protein